MKSEEQIPLKGYSQEFRNQIKFIDYLSDEQLQEINQILDWKCFAVDGNGRRFGNQANPHKRNVPQYIPDRRIVLMNQIFDLADKHVLEIGCFEGIHTIGLSLFAKKVTAFDSRIENVIKSIVRCALFDVHPTIFQYDTETNVLNKNWLTADIMHHVGVLYHLHNPVQHLLGVGQYIRQGIMLDTHYALDEEANENYEYQGKIYKYKKYKEQGYTDVFSGMYDSSKWLTLDDIISLLQESGFPNVDLIEKREERNGPRVLLIAKKD